MSDKENIEKKADLECILDIKISEKDVPLEFLKDVGDYYHDISIYNEYGHVTWKRKNEQYIGIFFHFNIQKCKDKYFGVYNDTAKSISWAKCYDHTESWGYHAIYDTKAKKESMRISLFQVYYLHEDKNIEKWQGNTGNNRVMSYLIQHGYPLEKVKTIPIYKISGDCLPHIFQNNDVEMMKYICKHINLFINIELINSTEMFDIVYPHIKYASLIFFLRDDKKHIVAHILSNELYRIALFQNEHFLKTCIGKTDACAVIDMILEDGNYIPTYKELQKACKINRKDLVKKMIKILHDNGGFTKDKTYDYLRESILSNRELDVKDFINAGPDKIIWD